MKNSILKTIFFLIFSVVLLSCTKTTETDQINPLEGYTKLEEGYAPGASAKVEIWGEKNFYVGFNKLMVVLYDSLNPKEKLTDARIHFSPLMTMNMNGTQTKHATPIEDPDETAINGVFPGAIAFVMPSVMGDSWKLGVAVHNPGNNKEGLAEFDINVDNPATSVLTVFTALTPDSTKLVLSLPEPSNPKVGMNDIEFTIHRKQSMMDWPADDSYTIEITPEMPSMGHGSPNNENPVSSGNGHYKGKVNFTMTGEWRVNVLVKKDGEAISKNLYFNITF